MKDEQGTFLGFVKFSSKAAILSNLTNNIDEKRDISHLVDALQPEESSSIGAGKKPPFSNS